MVVIEKVKTRADWEDVMVKENLCEKDEALGMLVVVGACKVGAVKQKVAKWLGLRKKEKERFERCWKNLTKNKVFRKGKVHADLSGDDAIITLILGYAQLKSVSKGAKIHNIHLWSGLVALVLMLINIISGLLLVA